MLILFAARAARRLRFVLCVLCVYALHPLMPALWRRRPTPKCEICRRLEKVRRCGARGRALEHGAAPGARAAGAHTGFRPSNILCGVWGDFMSRRMQSETRKGLVCGTRFFHPLCFCMQSITTRVDMLTTRAPSWRRLGERTCHSDMHGDASAIACADWCKQEKAHNHW